MIDMFLVTRELRFCYGHRLLEYDGKCRHLHGHNGRAVITLQSARLDELGMVMDFSKIKRVVGGWIDSHAPPQGRSGPSRDAPARRAGPRRRLQSDGREHREDDLRLHRVAGVPGDRGDPLGDGGGLRDLSRADAGDLGMTNDVWVYVG